MAEIQEVDGDASVDRIEALLASATSDMRAEVERLVRTGEASFERLARQLAQTLVREMIASASAQGAAAGNGGLSANQVAAAVAAAAKRGARFT